MQLNLLSKHINPPSHSFRTLLLISSFSTYKPNHNNIIIAKLSTQSSLSDILRLFHHSNYKFNLQQLSFACRQIAKFIHYQKHKPLSHQTIIQQFNQTLHTSIPSMNQIQLIDVLFLFRKQKLQDVRRFEFPKEMLRRIEGFVEEGRYSLRNLISLYYSYQVLNLDGDKIMTEISKKLYDPVKENIRDINISITSEFINAISHHRLIPSYFQKLLLAKILQSLQSNIPSSRVEISSLLNILYSLSQLHINHLPMLPFIKPNLPLLLSSFQNISSIDLLKLLALGRNTKDPAITKICVEIKKGIIKLINQNIFEFEFVMKILREIGEWSGVGGAGLTAEEQEMVVRYFEENQELCRQYNFNLHIPKMLRILEFENAKAVCDVILRKYEGHSLMLLIVLSEFVDVSENVMGREEFRVERGELELGELLKLANVFYNTKNLKKELKEFQKEIPGLIEDKIDFRGLDLKNFIKEVPLQLQNQLSPLFIKKLVTLYKNILLSLSSHNQFAFIVINLLLSSPSTPESSQTLNLLLSTLYHQKIFQKFSKINSRSIISMFSQSRFNTAYKFWNYAILTSLHPQKIIEALNIKFIQKTIVDVENCEYFLKWIVEAMNSSVVITHGFIEFIVMVVYYAESSLIKKGVIGGIVENMGKMEKTKVGYSTLIRLVREIKKEGYLTPEVATFFLKKHKNFQKQPLLSLQTISTAEATISKIKTITSQTLQYLLLFPPSHWTHLAPSVLQYLNTKQIKTHNWKRIVTSIKGEYMNDGAYAEIVEVVSEKILKAIDVENRRLQQYLHLLFEVVKIKGDDKRWKKRCLDKVKKVIGEWMRKRDGYFVVEGCINCLTMLGENKMKYLLDDQNGEKERSQKKRLFQQYLEFIWKFEVQVDQKDIQILFQILESKQLTDQDFKNIILILLLNDDLPSSSLYLSTNKQKLSLLNLPEPFHQYFNLIYFQPAQSPLNKLIPVGQSEQNKIIQLAKRNNLELQINPIVDRFQFNYKINGKYVLVVNGEEYLSFNQEKGRMREEQDLMRIRRKILSSVAKKGIIYCVSQGEDIVKVLKIITEKEREHQKELHTDKQKEMTQKATTKNNLKWRSIKFPV